VRWLPLLVVILAPRAAADPALDEAFPRSAIVIATERACLDFDVWLALEPRQQARGLMHVRSLAPTSGMLFVYSGEARRSMWMKNTYIPLDMLFIRDDGRVSSIVRDTEPLSLQSIASTEPVQYVLELYAGTTERLGIEPGDTMLWPELWPGQTGSENGGD